MISATGLMGWDLGLPRKDAAAIFKKRHKAALWHALIPFVIFGIVGFCFARFPELKPYGFYAIGFMFIVFFWGYIFLILCYRCPRCGRIPYSVAGVWAFPKHCANNECHAPLLPDHPWAH